MAKNLIIGAFTNYNYNQLKPWVESIDECGFDGDKVLIVGNASADTIKELQDRNFKLIQMQQMEGIPIHVGRFLYIYHYLKEHWIEYDHVVTTDVKDVYFQNNPFPKLEEMLSESNYTLIAASEGIAYCDEPWGNENLLQTFGQYVYDDFKNNEIYNVGVLGGTALAIKDICFNIFISAINRPIPIVDQAVYNVLINTWPNLMTTYFADHNAGWACQAGTTVDPAKIESFRPNLLCEEPYFKDGIVYNSDGIPFNIVHQYDRVPEWKKFVQEKYNQEDESKFFTYRT